MVDLYDEVIINITNGRKPVTIVSHDTEYNLYYY